MAVRAQTLRGLDLSAPHIRRLALSSPRFVHSSSRNNTSLPTPVPTAAFTSATNTSTAPPQNAAGKSVLSRIPTSSVLRSYAIMRMSSSPALLNFCFSILKRMLVSKSYLLSIERNPLLATLLKSTFYAQFCAGETKAEARQTMAVNRDILGYDAIMLEFALEVLGGESAAPTAAETAAEIEVWRKGMLQSIEIAKEGDFVGLKWSGLGRAALQLLKEGKDPSPDMQSAITAACDAAAAKNVALLPGAEEEATNPGLEKWCLDLQRRYNKDGKAVVYTTYQCYLKGIGSRIAAHLDAAATGNFTAGVKLVRGAYLASEPRGLIWENKEGTDACYDACADAVLREKYNDCVPASRADQAFPSVAIVLATHNSTSIERAQQLRSQQLFTQPPEALPKLAYIQLLGMADELSQALVHNPARSADTQARTVKCMTWGTTTECLNFLLRRASENKEAAMRTEETRRAMGAELWRRCKSVVGLRTA